MSSGLEIEEEEQRFTGRVKWFNNKAGFGFITACEGVQKDKDIFVHYSSINVPEDQYKYLVQGEYVDFELTKSEKSEHEFHAVHISGVKGGELMCETRKHILEARPYKPRVYKTPDENGSSKPSVNAPVRSAPVRSAQVRSAQVRSAQRQKNQPNDPEGFVKVPVRRPKNAPPK
jgi:CspA family cold shock protein